MYLVKWRPLVTLRWYQCHDGAKAQAEWVEERMGGEEVKTMNIDIISDFVIKEKKRVGLYS